MHSFFSSCLQGNRVNTSFGDACICTNEQFLPVLLMWAGCFCAHFLSKTRSSHKHCCHQRIHSTFASLISPSRALGPLVKRSLTFGQLYNTTLHYKQSLLPLCAVTTTAVYRICLRMNPAVLSSFGAISKCLKRDLRTLVFALSCVDEWNR